MAIAVAAAMMVTVGGCCEWWLWQKVVATAIVKDVALAIALASAMVVTCGTSSQCCEYGMFVPDPNFFHPGSWIPDPNFSIPDPGSRRSKRHRIPIQNTAGSGCGRCQLVTDLVGFRSCPVMLSDMSIMMNRCRIMPSFVFPNNS